MITSLEIQNFKCFADLRLSFGGLTLLTGFNAGGKTTAIQPLLLLAQGSVRSTDPASYSLNGGLVRLGTVADVLPTNQESGGIRFGLRAMDGESTWAFSTRAGDRSIRVTDAVHTRTAEGEAQPGNLSEVIYISAVREGTADVFPIPALDDERPADVGVDGRYAAYWYDRMVDEPVPESRRHPDEPATSVRKQLDAWLSYLFPGAQANVQAMPQVSLMSLQFRLSEIGDWRRPVNVGYGLTYVFPILVALLSAKDGQTIVIDSPEAHLHPFAQSQMGRLLGRFAAAGVQVIVETHSDHLLNGARLAVRDGTTPAENVRIYFFTGATAAGNGVISLALDPEGRIENWPEGFFDQTEKDLSRLAGWE
jgi:predicted ATPase